MRFQKAGKMLGELGEVLEKSLEMEISRAAKILYRFLAMTIIELNAICPLPCEKAAS